MVLCKTLQNEAADFKLGKFAVQPTNHGLVILQLNSAVMLPFINTFSIYVNTA